MGTTVRVTGERLTGEELRSLFSWLAGEDELRGRVRLAEAAPEPGTLGGWPEAVVVALGQGGAATVLVSALCAWIRHRTADVTCTLTRSDGTSVELTATRVRSTEVAELGALVEQVAAALENDDTGNSQEETG